MRWGLEFSMEPSQSHNPNCADQCQNENTSLTSVDCCWKLPDTLSTANRLLIESCLILCPQSVDWCSKLPCLCPQSIDCWLRVALSLSTVNRLLIVNYNNYSAGCTCEEQKYKDMWMHEREKYCNDGWMFLNNSPTMMCLAKKEKEKKKDC